MENIIVRQFIVTYFHTKGQEEVLSNCQQALMMVSWNIFVNVLDFSQYLVSLDDLE